MYMTVSVNPINSEGPVLDEAVKQRLCGECGELRSYLLGVGPLAAQVFICEECAKILLNRFRIAHLADYRRGNVEVIDTVYCRGREPELTPRPREPEPEPKVENIPLLRRLIGWWKGDK